MRNEAYPPRVVLGVPFCGPAYHDSEIEAGQEHGVRVMPDRCAVTVDLEMHPNADVVHFGVAVGVTNGGWNLCKVDGLVHLNDRCQDSRLGGNGAAPKVESA